jgi:hypothetical protein
VLIKVERKGEISIPTQFLVVVFSKDNHYAFSTYLVCVASLLGPGVLEISLVLLYCTEEQKAS